VTHPTKSLFHKCCGLNGLTNGLDQNAGYPLDILCGVQIRLQLLLLGHKDKRIHASASFLLPQESYPWKGRNLQDLDRNTNFPIPFQSSHYQHIWDSNHINFHNLDIDPNPHLLFPSTTFLFVPQISLCPKSATKKLP